MHRHGGCARGQTPPAGQRHARRPSVHGAQGVSLLATTGCPLSSAVAGLRRRVVSGAFTGGHGSRGDVAGLRLLVLSAGHGCRSGWCVSALPLARRRRSSRWRRRERLEERGWGRRCGASGVRSGGWGWGWADRIRLGMGSGDGAGRGRAGVEGDAPPGGTEKGISGGSGPAET
ncbi:hypothetical protein PAHAL_6G290300 [Panicum hallii]|uniref:Uncharacterized protein n=1 Tax=Panicum hallii TaxID=206008 RepID=A0A2S3I4E9_9POAL|nr:hypothetical protein PAHAL_6G290300 [Panicum hallii]